MGSPRRKAVSAGLRRTRRGSPERLPSSQILRFDLGSRGLWTPFENLNHRGHHQVTTPLKAGVSSETRHHRPSDRETSFSGEWAVRGGLSREPGSCEATQLPGSRGLVAGHDPTRAQRPRTPGPGPPSPSPPQASAIVVYDPSNVSAHTRSYACNNMVFFFGGGGGGGFLVFFSFSASHAVS